jgi:hypothetical protein
MPDGITAERLIEALQQSHGCRCPDCGARVCHHQALMNLYLGSHRAPRCLRCLADTLAIPLPALQDRVTEAIRSRDCYASAWEWASRQEGTGTEPLPPCLSTQP